MQKQVKTNKITPKKSLSGTPVLVRYQVGINVGLKLLIGLLPTKPLWENDVKFKGIQNYNFRHACVTNESSKIRQLCVSSNKLSSSVCEDIRH